MITSESLQYAEGARTNFLVVSSLCPTPFGQGVPLGLVRSTVDDCYRSDD